MLYSVVLTIHSILRWLVVLAGLFAIIRSITGLQFKRPWENTDDKAGLWFTILFDTQLLVGLILYVFLSPFTRPILAGAPGALGQPAALFFGTEHAAMMIIALALAHVGRVRSRKGATRKAQHTSAVLFYSLSLVAVLFAIPWPFLANIGRPLL